MTIRFLQTTESEVPGVPFMAGQIIHVDAPTPALLRCLDGVRAEVVKGAEPEYAVVRAPMVAASRHRKATKRSTR